MIVRALALSTAAVLATATLTSATVAPPQAAARHGVRTEAPTAARPALPPAGVVVTDGSVDQLLRRGDEVFVRGDFTKVGRYTGPAVALDPATGARDTSFATFDGTVSTSLADGDGGWYVGGDFTRIGTTARRGFVHLRADGSVDPTFDLRLPEGSMVNSLALAGDTLYVGGQLSTVRGLRRPGVAAISTTDGSVLPFRAAVPSYDVVTDIVTRPAAGGAGARVYLGTYLGLQAVGASSGRAIGSFSSPTDYDSGALALVDDSLYVSSQTGLDKLDPVTGAVDPAFDVRVSITDDGFNGDVAVVQEHDGLLYVGGYFARVNGRPGSLRAVDPATGAVDPGFAPRITSTSDDVAGVYDLAVTPAGLWVGGDFDTLDGRVSRKLGLVDAGTGARVPTRAPRFDVEVDTVELSEGTLFTGGRFFMPDYTIARGGVVLDARTLQVERTLVVPVLSGRDLLSSSGRLWVGDTHFTGYSTSAYARQHSRYYRSTRDRVVALDPDTGRVVPGVGFHVDDLTGLDTSRTEIVSVRRLEDDTRFPRNQVVVRSARTGEVKRSFTLPLRGYVTEVELRDSGDLFVAGSFRRFRENGQAAHLAVLHVSARGALDESFDPHVNGPVYDVAELGGNLYAAGIFGQWDNRAVVKGVAAFDVYGSFHQDFRPSTAAYERDDLRVVPLGTRVLLTRGFPLGVVDAETGRRLPDAIDGYGDVVTAAIPRTDGVTFAARLDNVPGEFGGGAGFIASTTTP